VQSLKCGVFSVVVFSVVVFSVVVFSVVVFFLASLESDDV